MKERFKEEELAEIRKCAHALINRGYFTGFNIIRSQTDIPVASITLHFLQNDQDQVEHVASKAALHGFQILPRETGYLFDLSYAKKPTFQKEYEKAKFFDRTNRPIPLPEVIAQVESPLVVVEELDLTAPLSPERLEETVIKIFESNKTGNNPWIDPVLIVKSSVRLRKVPGFSRKFEYISVPRLREEAYTLLETKKKRFLRKYVANLECVSDLAKDRTNTLVFNPMQVNDEFVNYVVQNLREFEP